MKRTDPPSILQIMCNDVYNVHLETQCVNDAVVIGTVDVDTALRFSVDSDSGTYCCLELLTRL